MYICIIYTCISVLINRLHLSNVGLGSVAISWNTATRTPASAERAPYISVSDEVWMFNLYLNYPNLSVADLLL